MKPSKRSIQNPTDQDRRRPPNDLEKEPQADDPVDEASEESFPASDPPAYNPQKTGN